MTLKFFLPFAVVAKQSMRVRPMKLASGKLISRNYKPKEVQDNENWLCALLAQHRPPHPIEGPLRAEYTFMSPWRKSDSRKRRAEGTQPKDTKPDCDNLAKQLNDVMEKMGFFVNDAQIADLHVKKIWTDRIGVLVLLSDEFNKRKE